MIQDFIAKSLIDIDPDALHEGGGTWTRRRIRVAHRDRMIKVYGTKMPGNVIDCAIQGHTPATPPTFRSKRCTATLGRHDWSMVPTRCTRSPSPARR
jgi:hypothetical protein